MAHPSTYLPAASIDGDELLWLTDSPGPSQTDRRATVDQVVARALALPGLSAAVKFLQAGAGAVERTAQDKAREAVSVRDFGAVGDGVANDSPAFQAAVNSFASGATAPIRVPAGLYDLPVQIAANGRLPVFLCEPGATFVAADPNTRFVWPARLERYVGRVRSLLVANDGTNRTFQAMGSYEQIRNTGGTGSAGYGRRLDYISTAFGSGFDIADGIIARWERSAGQDGGQQLAQWLVAIGPQVGGVTTRSGTFAAEMNVINRHADHGWSKQRGTLNNWAVILQVVPEANTFGNAGVAYDLLAGLMLSRSSGNKGSDSLPARMHNAILLEPDSITPTGRAIYMSGRNLLAEAQTPVAGVEIDDWWQRGFSTRRATLTTGVAYGMGLGQGIAWLDGSDAALIRIMGGNGSPEGVVMAAAPALWIRADGAPGTFVYLKETGAGNTGWVAKW